MTRATTDRRTFVTASAAAMLLPGAAFGQSTPKITYLTPFGYLMGFAEAMYADTGGFFKKHGLDVTIEGGKGSAMSVQQVSAGNVLCTYRRDRSDQSLCPRQLPRGDRGDLPQGPLFRDQPQR